MAKKIDNTELNSATPVETPENVKKLVAEAATPKPAREAKLKAETALASDEDVKPDYAALGIEEEEVETYEELRLRFKDLGRRSTSQVFECGEVVAALQELTPDQETFEKRAKAVLNLSRRGAENYGNVHHHLQPYRKRLVQVAMIASALYDLATAEPEQIEAVLAARESGQELTGKQIKEMLGKASGPSTAPDDGGAAGLRARIAEKTSIGVGSLMDNAASLLEALLVALEPHRQGKRIVVKATQHSFIHPARLVREQLEWLTWLAVPAPASYAEGAIHHAPVVKQDRWAELHATLDRLGDFDGWPAAAEVGPWLADVVVPQLGWLLGDRAKKAFAVVDKMAAAAEAERLKEEQARARKKAEAKKAREKVKLEKAKAEKRAAREAKALAKLAAAQSQEAASTRDADPAPSAGA